MLWVVGYHERWRQLDSCQQHSTGAVSQQCQSGQHQGRNWFVVSRAVRGGVWDSSVGAAEVSHCVYPCLSPYRISRVQTMELLCRPGTWDHVH